MNVQSEACLEQYVDLPSIKPNLCDQCGSFYITYEERNPLIDYVQDRRLCCICRDASFYREKRLTFPDNPYNVKNWIAVDVRVELFKCYGECNHDINKKHNLSDNQHGAVSLRKYVFRNHVFICEVCFYDFSSGQKDKKGLEDAANS